MGALNDGVHEKHGRIRGVIHARFVIDKEEHPSIVDLTIVEGEDLQERKKALVQGVDAIIALPGTCNHSRVPSRFLLGPFRAYTRRG